MMAKKYELQYSGTGPGQAATIERAGFVFYRGCSTEVPKKVFDELKDEEGFADANASSAKESEGVDG